MCIRDRLDVLGYLDEIPVCTGYEINGEVTTEFPVTSLLEKMCIRDSPDAEESLLIVSTLHAREYICSAVMMKEIQYYLEN